MQVKKNNALGRVSKFSSCRELCGVYDKWVGVEDQNSAEAGRP